MNQWPFVYFGFFRAFMDHSLRLFHSWLCRKGMAVNMKIGVVGVINVALFVLFVINFHPSPITHPFVFNE
jgi:hypothetical protein